MAKLVTFEGKNFSFPDDATDEEVSNGIAAATKEQSIGNALSNVPLGIQQGFTSAAKGAMELTNDMVYKPLTRLGQSLQNPVAAVTGTLPEPASSPALGVVAQEKQRLTQELQNRTEGTPSILTEGIASGAESVGSQALNTGLGALRGVNLVRGGMEVVPALKQGAELGLKLMAGQEAAKEYGDQREGDSSPLSALGHSAVVGAAEYFPEKWAYTKLIDAVGGKSAIGQAALGFLLRDMGGEQLTTAVEDLNRKLSINPNMSLADWWRDFQVTAVSTALSGPLQAGMGHVTNRVAVASLPQEAVARTANTPASGTPAAGPSPVLPTVSETPVEAPTPPPTETRGSLVVDSTLPLIGMPGESQQQSRQLPVEQQLELLRKAYADMENTKSFQDTAEDRIRRKQEFVLRRTEVEDALKMHPEGRQFLLAADEAMGVSRPEIDVPLEVSVNDFATLTPEQAQQREAARETKRQERWVGTPLEQVPLREGGDPARASLGGELGLTGNAEPTSGSNVIPSTKATNETLAGQPVLRSSNPSLVGKTYEQAVLEAKPEDVVYTAAPGEEDEKNAADMLSVLQSLKDKFLPGSALFVGHVPTSDQRFLSRAWKVKDGVYAINMPTDNEGEWPGLSGNQYVRSAVGRLGDILRLNVSRSLASRLDTLTHEFTHVLHYEHWHKATPEEKVAVAKEYHDDLRKAYNLPWKDGIRLLYSAKTAERLIANAAFSGLSADATLGMPSVQAAVGINNPSYWFNFNEWMAHKGVKYFQTRLGVTRENVPFFRRWLAKMKSFYAHYSAQFAEPPKGFAQWMDNIAERESRGLGLAMEADIADAKEKLVQAGVDPALADLVSTVNGNRTQVLNNAVFQLQERQKTAELIANYTAVLDKAAAVFLRVTSRAQVEKAVEAGKLPRDLATALLNSPRFKDPFKFNKVEFAYNLLHNTLSVNQPLGGVGDTAMELAHALETLRGLAEHGEILTDISSYSKEIQRFLANGEKVDAKHFEIPYWAYETPVNPSESEPDELRLPQSVRAVGAKFGIPWLSSAGNALGRFNWLYGKALGAYELINLNENVPGMQEERAALRNRMMYRHQWLAPANERVEEWAYKIGKTEAAKLGKLLFDEAENGVWLSTRQQNPNGSGYVFQLTPAAVNKYGLSQQAQELYSKIRNDFYTFAEEWHKVALWEFARGELSDVSRAAIHRLLQAPGNLNQVQQIADMEVQAVVDPVKFKRLSEALKEINDEFKAWREMPYMPYTRFGRYGVLARDATTGKTLYFSGHDSLAEAREQEAQTKKARPGAAVSTTFLEDNVYELAGLPPAILTAMKSKLRLDPQQQEVFGQVLRQLSLANSFRHHAAVKRGIDGYSLDALRVYSDYFRRGSGFMARVKSNPELSDAQELLKKHIQQLEEQGGFETVNLHQLHQWFGELHKYLNNAGNDYGQLKSIVAMFHFAGNVSTAVMNATQVPLVTLPWLSERYGIAEATKALGKAYKDALHMYAKPQVLSADERALYEHGLASGFIDESQATVIGQMADGAALSRATLTGWGQRAVGLINHWGMLPFAMVEKQNRVSTLLAAYRLARSPNFRGAFDEAAANFARQAVEDTQNEYAQENRPEIMRKEGGVLLQFMHYTTHMLFMQLGGDKSWWRLLVAQLFAGGLLGLPFAEDLTNAAKFIGRKVGQNWEPELLLREWLVNMGANQDLVARGLFSDVFGFDLSKRVSMGEVIPGMRALGSNRKFDQVLYDAIGDVGGPGVSLVMNALKFLSEDDKLAWNAVRRILPSAVKNLGNAGMALKEGEVRDGSGAKVFEPDVWDTVGMAAGFSPKKLSEHYLKGTLQSEQAAYWVNRKQALLDIGEHVMFDRGQDREAWADFMKRVRVYNEEAPAAMRLTGDSLRASLRAKQKGVVAKELGYGAVPGMREEAQKISDVLSR